MTPSAGRGGSSVWKTVLQGEKRDPESGLLEETQPLYPGGYI